MFDACAADAGSRHCGAQSPDAGDRHRVARQRRVEVPQCSEVFALLNEVSPLPGLCWVEVDLVL